MTPNEKPSDHVDRELDCVVLLRDLPEAGLGAGEVGTVACVYGPDALEVEFEAKVYQVRQVRAVLVEHGLTELGPDAAPGESDA